MLARPADRVLVGVDDGEVDRAIGIEVADDLAWPQPLVVAFTSVLSSAVIDRSN